MIILLADVITPLLQELSFYFDAAKSKMTGTCEIACRLPLRRQGELSQVCVGSNSDRRVPSGREQRSRGPGFERGSSRRHDLEEKNGPSDKLAVGVSMGTCPKAASGTSTDDRSTAWFERSTRSARAAWKGSPPAAKDCTQRIHLIDGGWWESYESMRVTVPYGPRTGRWRFGTFLIISSFPKKLHYK